MFNKPIVGAPPDRAALVAQLAQLEREAVYDSAELRTRIEHLEAQALTQKDLLAATLRQLQGLHSRRVLDSGRLNIERSLLRRQLDAVADPQIHAALRRLDIELERVRARQPQEGLRFAGKIRMPSLKPVMKSVTNRPALGRITAAAVAARAALESLTYQHSDVEDLAPAIAAIEATIPWADLDALEPDEDDLRPVA